MEMSIFIENRRLFKPHREFREYTVAYYSNLRRL